MSTDDGNTSQRNGARLRAALRIRMEEYRYRIMSAFGREQGVNRGLRDPQLIVSLTTIPERIDTVAYCIESLLRQSLKPDRVILWLSLSNEPGKRRVCPDSLPSILLRAARRGLDIQWCDDIGSYRKIVPTLRKFPAAIVATADDDILYPRHWLESLYRAYQREPQYIHCHLAHQISYDNSGMPLPYRQWNMRAPGVQGPSLDLFPTCGAGALYAPGHLHPEALCQDTFLSLCPRADDVWLKAMSLLAETPCKKVALETFEITSLRIPNNRTLFSYNVGASGNDLQIAEVNKRYGCFYRCPEGAAKAAAR